MNILHNIKKRIIAIGGKPFEINKPCSASCSLCNESNYCHWIYKENKRDEMDRCLINGIFMSHWIPILVNRQSVSLEDQLEHSWSSENKSINIQVRPGNPRIVSREPIPNSTDSIRGKRAYTHGVHMWRINWTENMRGTHATIGVSTDKSILQYDAYVPLVGIDKESWGWDIVNLKAVHDLGEHNPIEQRKYPNSDYMSRLEKSSSSYHASSHVKVPPEISVILDMDNGTLSYMCDGKFLGVAHTGLKGKTLYPAIGSVWGRSEIEIRYHNSVCDEVPTLKELAIYKFKKIMSYHLCYNEVHGRRWIVENHKINTDIDPSVFLNRLNIPKTLKDEIDESFSNSLKNNT